MTVDYYKVLKVQKSSTQEEIKKAYVSICFANFVVLTICLQVPQTGTEMAPGQESRQQGGSRTTVQANLTSLRSTLRWLVMLYSQHSLIQHSLIHSTENKRRKYDLYGNEDASGGARRSNGYHHFSTGLGDDIFSSFFHFRDPNDVFREFFHNTDPFGAFNGANGTSNGHSNAHANGHASAFAPFANFGFNFGNLQPFVEPFPNCHSSFTTFSSDDLFGEPLTTNGGKSSASAPKPTVKRTTTSTKYVNGKKVETRK